MKPSCNQRGSTLHSLLLSEQVPSVQSSESVQHICSHPAQHFDVYWVELSELDLQQQIQAQAQVLPCMQSDYHTRRNAKAEKMHCVMMACRYSEWLAAICSIRYAGGISLLTEGT